MKATRRVKPEGIPRIVDALRHVEYGAVVRRSTGCVMTLDTAT